MDDLETSGPGVTDFVTAAPSPSSPTALMKSRANLKGDCRLKVASEHTDLAQGGFDVLGPERALLRKAVDDAGEAFGEIFFGTKNRRGGGGSLRVRLQVWPNVGTGDQTQKAPVGETL